MNIGAGIFSIITLAIIVIVLTSVFLPTVQNIDTSNISGQDVSFTAGEAALWGVIGLVAIAGFVYSTAAAFGLA